MDDSAVKRAGARDEVAWLDAVLDTPITQPLVRVWRYDAPAVVLGRSQRSNEAIEARAAAAGVQLCVRQSGGGAVLAGPWMLSASIVLPPRHALVTPSIAASFRWLGEAFAAWLGDLDIDALLVPQPVAPQAATWACFAGLSYWEVTADDAKIVGLAQARRRHGVLFSAAVLVAPSPWEVLCEVFGAPIEDADALAAGTTSCAQVLGHEVDPEALAPSLYAALAARVAAAG
jgi:lipoate-protein ligase A